MEKVAQPIPLWKVPVELFNSSPQCQWSLALTPASPPQPPIPLFLKPGDKRDPRGTFIPLGPNTETLPMLSTKPL